MSIPYNYCKGLSSFAGSVHKKYVYMDAEHILRYVAHRLHNNQTAELIVLQELIYRMTGIKPISIATEAQIVAMSGGPTLRVEALASDERGALEERAVTNGKARERLINSLRSSGLMLPLLVLIARHRQTCVFTSSEDHLKSLANTYDTVSCEVLLSVLPS